MFLKFWLKYRANLTQGQKKHAKLANLFDPISVSILAIPLVETETV